MHGIVRRSIYTDDVTCMSCFAGCCCFMCTMSNVMSLFRCDVLLNRVVVRIHICTGAYTGIFPGGVQYGENRMRFFFHSQCNIDSKFNMFK